MGKLVTFWSPYRGQAKVTSTMCAVAAAMGLLYPELEIALSHAQPNSIELEERLDCKIGWNKKRELLEKTGVSALKLNYRQSVLTSEKIRCCAIPLLMKSLYLFSGSSNQDQMDELWFRILTEKLVKEFSWTFLDLESGFSDTSVKLMKAADVAVIVMPQIPGGRELFPKNKSELWNEKKMCMILGGYLHHSRYSPSYFFRKKEHRYGLPMVGAIPVNAGYMDAMSEGRTLDFFLRNEFAEKKEENYEFIIQAKRTAEALKRYTE